MQREAWKAPQVTKKRAAGVPARQNCPTVTDCELGKVMTGELMEDYARWLAARFCTGRTASGSVAT